jgi:hypothetical protein
MIPIRGNKAKGRRAVTGRGIDSVPHQTAISTATAGNKPCLIGDRCWRINYNKYKKKYESNPEAKLPRGLVRHF